MKTLEELADEYTNSDMDDECAWLNAGAFFQKFDLLGKVLLALVPFALKIAEMASSKEEVDKIVTNALSETVSDFLKRRGSNN